MKVRTFTETDLASLHAIQRKCFQSAQWRPDDYTKLANDPLGLVLVAEWEGENPPQLAGFAAFHRVLDEAELLNLAVDAQYRRKGIALALITAGIEALRTHGVSCVFLEVRTSNQAAIDFYTAVGFKLQRKRRHYYHDPVEDALVMAWDIAKTSSPSSPQPQET